jgi:hypothetical protein
MEDQLVPDTAVLREFGVCSMTLSRWSKDPALNFPAAIKIKSRNYRSRRELDVFKSELLRKAISERTPEKKGGA